MKTEHQQLFLALKEKSGLSNQQIADRTELSISTINRFFRGEIDNPDLNKVGAILDVMGYPLANIADDRKIVIDHHNVEDLLAPYADHIAEPYRKQIDLLRSDNEHLHRALRFQIKECT